MTYEQKFGRLPDGLVDMETPPEEWQFENPIATGKITGRKPIEVPKLNLEAILPKPKEVEKMNFKQLPLEKRLRIVAEEYKTDKTIKEIVEQLGISHGTISYYVKKAHKAGLISEMRGGKGARKRTKPAEQVEELQAKVVPEVQVEVVPVEEQQAEPEAKITPDLFWAQAEHSAKRASKLLEDAKRLERAGTIADDLIDLLGDTAQDLIDALYVRVS